MLKTLFSPMHIGKLEIANRAVVTAIVTNYCSTDGTATEKYIAYHNAKAKGGWGLIITEGYAIDPTGKSFPQAAGLWDDKQIESHSELPRRVHAFTSKIFAQIYHSGRKTNRFITDLQPLAPSSILYKGNQEIPHELTIDEIHDLIEKFGDCALRAKRAGFDGVEILGAHGYLIAEFLSQLTNKRTDEYGGNLYNRLRFAVEVIACVKEKAGKDFPVGFRISADEFTPGGNTIEDAKAMAILLEQAGADVLNVSADGYPGFPSSSIQPGVVPHGYLTDYAEKIKKIVKVPVITIGRINDPLLAEAILSSGKADFIGMARASLADPDFPNKAARGKFDDIIKCIACMQGCAGRLFCGEPIKCVVNPTLGREAELEKNPADIKKKVIIIGGGPAGMEAAITAARAGHEVKLFEKTDRLGGQFYLAGIPPGKGEISSFIAWQIKQINALNICLHLNKHVSFEIIEAEKPDLVIIATGGTPIIPKISGVDKGNVVNAVDVLGGKVSVGARAIIIGGGLVGAETANHIASEGRTVMLVELLPEIIQDEISIARKHLLKALKLRNVRIFVNTAVTEIRDDGAVIRKDGKEERIYADTVILAVGARPENTLMLRLENGPYNFVAIGDAVKVRKGLEAVEEGYLAGIQA